MEKPSDIRVNPEQPIEFTFNEGKPDEIKFTSFEKVIEFLKTKPGAVVFTRNIDVRHSEFLNAVHEPNKLEFVRGSSRGSTGKWRDWMFVRVKRIAVPCDVTGLY